MEIDRRFSSTEMRIRSTKVREGNPTRVTDASALT